MSLPRETLLRFREGEAAAFAEVVRMYSPKVRSIAARYLWSIFHQEEAAQEAWLQVARQHQALDPDRLDTFEAWLMTMARRRCIDYSRSIGRGEAREHADETAVTEQAAPEPVEDSLEARDLRHAVEEFTSRLEPGWREFFQLHFVQGLDYGEVSARLSVSRIRCKYMKKVIAARARRNRPLLEALGRYHQGGSDAPTA